MTFKELGGYLLLALGLLVICVLGGMVYTGTYMIPNWPQDVRNVVLMAPVIGLVWVVVLRNM